MPMAKLESEYVQNLDDLKKVQSVLVGPLAPVSGKRPLRNGIKGPVMMKSAIAMARRVVGYPYVCKSFSIAKGRAAPDTPEALHKSPYANPLLAIQNSLTILRMG